MTFLFRSRSSQKVGRPDNVPYPAGIRQAATANEAPAAEAPVETAGQAA